MTVGLLLVRVVFGLLMAAHGAQKFFGWFGGHGLDGTAVFFDRLGFRPGRLFAAAASLGELTGGLLIAAGLFGPIGPALVVAIMIVAAVSVHWQNGLFASTSGIELALLYGVSAASLALTGFGAWSLDGLLGLTAFWTPALGWTALAIGVLGGVGNLALRRTTPSAVVA